MLNSPELPADSADVSTTKFIRPPAAGTPIPENACTKGLRSAPNCDHGNGDIRMTSAPT